MTTRQFRLALARHGMEWAGFMGYVSLGYGRRVSVLNVGAHAGYRAWLAYLLREQARAARETQEGRV